jgi:ketosteroid isomerase-like protein
MYTTDAVLLEPGSAPIAGRPALLAMAKTMAPLSAVKFSPERTECSGNLAYMYGRASWINGRPPAEGTASSVYLVIVWRKEADGQWRVAQEVFVPDTPQK